MPATAAMEQHGTFPEASRLCMQCGLCCDGTLFERANILEGDDFSYTDALGVTPGRKGKGFPQPCAALKNRVCSMYSSRPQVCEKYKCRLLKQFENGKVSFEDAMQVIVQTVEHATKLRTALEAEVKEKDAPLLRLYLILKELAPLSPENARVFLDFAAMQVRLNRHFRKKVELLESPPAAMEPDAGMKIE